MNGSEDNIRNLGLQEDGKVIEFDIDEIEDEISEELNTLLKDIPGSHFLVDKWKSDGIGIDIIFPGIQYPGNRSIVKNPDHVRFLLSLYPNKERLANIRKIILLPRYIEAGGIELVSIYIRKEKILVLYLHQPHYYLIDNTQYNDYSFIPYLMPGYIRSESSWGECINGDRVLNRVPPLWYILSIISFSEDDKIDKFFIINKDVDSKVTENLENTSFFYKRHGF